MTAISVQIVVPHGGHEAVGVFRACFTGGKVRRQSGTVIGSVESGRE
ncbi:hypothetical protein [Kribbella sp. C-35]